MSNTNFTICVCIDQGWILPISKPMRAIRLLSLLICVNASGAMLNSNGSASDTQTQINSASTGDTVLLPSSGSFSWGSAVSIPNTKSITVDGNNSTITLTAAFSLTPKAFGSTTYSRITGFKLNISGSGGLDINDSPTTAWFRVDHCIFTGTLSPIVNMQGQGGTGGGGGVMDHCVFTNIANAQETMHINGWGDGIDAGWTTDVVQSNLLYIEDCTFTGAQGNSSCCFQGYYGTRTSARYNVVNSAMLEQHGTGGSIGVRWWEFYENKLTNMTMCLRAGSGVIFSNTCSSVTLAMMEEDSGYPANYQIGRGKNETLDPAYYWNDSSGETVSLNCSSCCAPGVANMVQLNRDVFNSAKAGYTAFTYPHPLVSGSPTTPVITAALSGGAAMSGTGKLGQ